MALNMNMKSLTQALAKTAAVIEKHVQSTVLEVAGPRALQDYELVDLVGSAGPGLAWKLYSGRPRNRAEHAHNPEVCVWTLDKKALGECRQRLGLSKASEDAFLDVLRSDAAQLLKLRHPGVLRVVQALDENKAAMAMVTEPIFACVANVLGDLGSVTKFPKQLKNLELSLLEVKHGLLQLTESLAFLHNNAQLVHRAISPEAVFITSSGSWKFGGFGFATSVEQAASEAQAGPSFHYAEYDMDDYLLPVQPPLDYTAPELTRSGGNAGPCSDMFSLACFAYHLLSRQPAIQCKNNLRVFRNRVQYLTSASFAKIPPELVSVLQSMLSINELSRPSAHDFTGSPFFRQDTRLRALRFLDHMLERDNLQKTDFLKALSNMWTDFDARVLRYKVLPPLCLELRNQLMLPLVLPMVLTIAESQDAADFELSTLPALLPVLSSATGESLLLLVKHAALLVNKVGPEYLTTSVVPMLIRAFNDPDARMQEEVLKRVTGIAKQIDYQVLKQSILPRIHSLALVTTVAAVRVNALLCLSELVHRLDKHAVKEVLETLQRCTAVDHSSATLMCSLDVCVAIYKQLGVEYAAENILPLLAPLLIAQQLNQQQFTKYMGFVKEVLRVIEEKRGLQDGTARASVTCEAALVASNNGRQQQQQQPAERWDDWGTPPRKAGEDDKLGPPSTPPLMANASLAEEASSNWSLPLTLRSSRGSSASSGVTQALEWPPPLHEQQQKQQQQQQQQFLTAAAAAGEEVDPFADWPPPRMSAPAANNNSMNWKQQQQADLASTLFSSSSSSTNRRKELRLRLSPPPPPPPPPAAAAAAAAAAQPASVLDLLQ